MRKRRRLADKLTIMVCAVLVVVSAFFYAPMEVEAAGLVNGCSISEFYSLTPQLAETFSLEADYDMSSNSMFYSDGSIQFGHLNFGSDYDNDTFYNLNVSFKLDISTSVSTYARGVSLFDLAGQPSYSVGSNNYFYGSDLVWFFSAVPQQSGSSTTGGGSTSHKLYYDVDIVLKGSQIKNNDSLLRFYLLTSQSTTYSANFNLQYTLNSVTELSSTESEEYQNGYNAGYAEGESAGYGNGYSQGFVDGESSVDTNEIYNQGFNAGKESVDTDSYYDAGYEAGFQVAFQDGYDSGYDEGYQSAMDRIGGWGADTSDYPVYITSSSSESGFLSGYVYGNSQVYDEENIILNFDINPNHIYRFDVKLGFPRQTSYSNVYGSYTAVYFCAGGVDYFISPTVNFGQGTYESVFVRGDILSSSFSKKGVVNVVTSSVTNPDLPVSFSFDGFWHDVQVYDVGPIGNMQNHIANQTDQLTGGYNDSQGNSVNNDFSAGLNDFETAEDSLFATATTGLKDFTFFDIQSVPAMVTGMSFVGSIMSGWFSQAGGASGVGIVLSILFSIMLVAMVLGLYRWYQSKGGKD